MRGFSRKSSVLKQQNIHGEYPAVTLAIAKQPGTNAVEIANQVIERVEDQGYKVGLVVTVVDRQEGGVETLAAISPHLQL